MSSFSFLRRHAALDLALVLAALSVPSDVSALPTFTDQGATILGGLNVSGRSASLADIDNDGDLDLFFQGGGTSSQRLLLNNVIGTGAHTFTDITSTLLPSPTLEDSWSAAWGDYDGDEKIDIYVGQDNNNNTVAGMNAGYDKGDVLTNNWPGPFTNTSAATGLNDPGFHQNVAWADIDHDRDLLIGMEGPTEKHQVYLQGPASHFTPVGAAVGFQQDVGTKAYGMAIGDTDGDIDPDPHDDGILHRGTIPSLQIRARCGTGPRSALAAVRAYDSRPTAITLGYGVGYATGSTIYGRPLGAIFCLRLRSRRQNFFPRLFQDNSL